MKTIRFSRRQILSAIQAACVALFLAAGIHRAAADPVYTEPYYELNGSIVTGTGVYDNAHFQDAGTNGYTVNVHSGADLGNAGHSQIEIDHGTVNNHGTLTYTGSNIYLSGVVLRSAGLVNNYDSITAPNSFGVQFFGKSGELDNRASGVINSYDGTFFAGDGTVDNQGSIVATNPQFGIPVESRGIGTVHNGGTMTGSVYGVQLNFGFKNGTNLVTNSGSITATSGRAVQILGYGDVMSSGEIAATGPGTTSNGIEAYGGLCHVTNSKGGSISGEYQGIYFVGGGTVANGAGATIEGSGAGVFIDGDAVVTNAGVILDSNGTVEAQGIGVITGTAEVYNSGDVFLLDLDDAEGILIDTGKVVNSGNIELINTTSGYGIYVGVEGTVSNTSTGSIVSAGPEGKGIVTLGSVAVTNAGHIEAGEYGVYVRGDNSSVLTSSGIIEGDSDAIVLAGTNSTVTVSGAAVTKGTIEGGAVASGNVLKFRLTGLTSEEEANFAAYVAKHTNSGTYSLQTASRPTTYTWADFANVTFK